MSAVPDTRPSQSKSPLPGLRRILTPEILVSLRQGYSFSRLRDDVLAGITVATVALPLAMALAIASGARPEQGLLTGVVAGVLVSALGGSRVVIGGPTGALVVVAFAVIQRHGYDGLALATLIAGCMLMLAGLARLGSWIKWFPLPVISGLTSGLAVIIAVSQFGELLGLDLHGMPAGVAGKLRTYLIRLDQVNAMAAVVGTGALALMLALRRWAPRLPGPLIVLAIAAIAVHVVALPVPTIGARFGDVAFALPSLHWPAFSISRISDLLPSAVAIAFLAGVESLLCAVVADGMTGFRHRSNTELVGQGLANCASALVGGVPASGALARTATNVRSGATTPVAGIVHAIALLLLAVLSAPFMPYLPIAAVAAVLLLVAWNMSGIERFRHLSETPLVDRLVLLLVFALTVAADLTVAIGGGVVLASISVVPRMVGMFRSRSRRSRIRGDETRHARDLAAADRGIHRRLPAGVEYFELQGPFSLGAANVFADVIGRIASTPHACVLVLRDVPVVDASGVAALRALAGHCRRKGTRLMLAELRPEVAAALGRTGVLALHGVDVYESAAAALEDADVRS
jgi:SulP family sulfate permease